MKKLPPSKPFSKESLMNTFIELNWIRTYIKILTGPIKTTILSDIKIMLEIHSNRLDHKIRVTLGGPVLIKGRAGQTMDLLTLILKIILEIKSDLILIAKFIFIFHILSCGLVHSSIIVDILCEFD